MKLWLKKRQDQVLESGALGRAMQGKVAVCAAEAAVISVVVHLLFIFFAGSLVVLSVVLGPPAEPM